MQRPVGRLTSLTMGWRPLPFDLRGALLRTCSREGLLELENEEYAVSRLGRAQPLLPPALIFTLGYLSPGDSLQLFSLGPIYLLPQFLSPCPCSSIFFFLIIFFFFFYKFTFSFLAALGLLCCVRAFSSCGEWGSFFTVVRGPLIVVASPITEHGL